jgi:Flp pilus assembly pilin Flp
MKSTTQLLEEAVMKTVKSLLVKVVKNEDGGEVLEYAVVGGMLVVGALVLIAAVGVRIRDAWTGMDVDLTP